MNNKSSHFDMHSAFRRLMEDGEGSVTGGEEYLPSLHTGRKKIKEANYSMKSVLTTNRGITLAVKSWLESNPFSKQDWMNKNFDSLIQLINGQATSPQEIQSLITRYGSLEEYLKYLLVYLKPELTTEGDGYETVKGFKPGHTPDRGGFQYKELWEGETVSDVDYAPIVKTIKLVSNKLGLDIKNVSKGKIKIQTDSNFTVYDIPNQAVSRFDVRLSDDESQIDITVPDSADMSIPNTVYESYAPSSTNAKELHRVKDLLNQAHKDKSYSVMSAYEQRIKMLTLLVNLEKKNNTTLPPFVGMYIRDYLAKYFPGYEHERGNSWKAIADHITQSITKQESVNENIERDQKVKIVKGQYAGNTAIVHDFDSEKDTASGDDWVDVLVGDKKEKKTVKASELKPLNENYARFKNETKLRNKPEQFHQGVKSVQKKIQEISKLHAYLERLQLELSEGEGGLKYKKYTEAAIQKIKDQVKELYSKTKKMK